MMVPYFFPNGGLYVKPKTLRIRIRTRLAVRRKAKGGINPGVDYRIHRPRPRRMP
jgi:hypothetical protein